MKSFLTLAIAAGFFLLCIENRALGDNRFNRARLDVKSLDQAVTAWRLRTGEWPSNLAVLTERSPDGSPALMKDLSALIDPWNEPYRYDPKQLSPEAGKPLIWTDGPPGVSNAKIANWGEGSNYTPPTKIPWEAVAIAMLIGMAVLFLLWICLPRSDRRLMRNPQALAGWLLVALVLGAAACYCYVVYTTFD